MIRNETNIESKDSAGKFKSDDAKDQDSLQLGIDHLKLLNEYWKIHILSL